MKAFYAAVVLLTGICCLGGPAWGEAGADNAVLRLIQGRDAYRNACAACHGAEGDGQGDVSSYMNPRPRDFRKGVLKFQTTPCGSLPQREDIERIVRDGLPGTKMPGWAGMLSDEEISSVAAFVLQLITSSPRPAGASGVPPETAVDAPGIERGRKVFEDLECAKCHGPSGRGDGPSAGTLKDDWGGSVRPRDFTKALFKSGGTNTDLYRVIVQGICGTPMPSHQDLVSPEELWDVVHYVRSLGKEKGLWERFFGLE
ncbi:MAG: c-type cytochrome [Nitrospirae bacterium]|nr:c-type cytochrome [Nitrospirota bacterium]